MDLNLTNRRVIVTGGADGIGKAVVQGLAVEGAIPVIIDRDRERAESLQKSLSKDGFDCEIVIADLGSADSCRRAILDVVDKDEQLYGLVNNAGANDGVGLESPDPNAFSRSLEHNLVQVYQLTRNCLPYLRRSRGSIVNIGSKTALTGQGGTSGYVASKAGILGLTREWALDLSADGIRVNAVIPAEVFTPQYRRWLESRSNPSAERERIEALIPLDQRFTRPDEIAASVLFLLSDRSSHTTGQWLHVDGGYVHLDRAFTSPVP